METKKIFIVDDHPVVVAGVTSVIHAKPEYQVIGSAATINDAIAKIRTLQPDVTIIDISLKNFENGLELVKKLKSENYPGKILVMSRYEDQVYAEKALQAGALGYLMKDEAGEQILDALEKILAGKIYLKEELQEKILSNLIVSGGSVGGGLTSTLTTREKQIFEMIGRGMSTREIAESLLLSISTVETHCQHIKEKLQLKNSRELTKTAVQYALSDKII